MVRHQRLETTNHRKLEMHTTDRATLPMQTLDEHTATQYVLHKHHLLESSQSDSVLQVVNDVVGLHATAASTPCTSLFNRMKSFERRHLDEEFYVKRNLIRIEAMRGTLFITSAELAPMLYQATRLSERFISKWISRWGLSKSEHQLLSEKLQSILSNGGKTLPEIRKALPKEMTRSLLLKVGNDVYHRTNISIVLNAMMRQGLVISEKHAAMSRITEANRYRLVHEVYPQLRLESVTSHEAKVILTRLYIKGFGPAAEEDIAWWTGFSKTETKAALSALTSDLLYLRIKEFPRDYFMLRSDYEQFSKFKPSPRCSVSLLPYEDPYTKGYKLRDRLVNLDWEKKAYIGGGVEPTIVVEGKTVGIWNRTIEKSKGSIQLKFFQSLDKEAERLAIQKAKTIAKLMTDREVSVQVSYL